MNCFSNNNNSAAVSAYRVQRSNNRTIIERDYKKGVTIRARLINNFIRVKQENVKSCKHGEMQTLTMN